MVCTTTTLDFHTMENDDSSPKKRKFMISSSSVGSSESMSSESDSQGSFEGTHNARIKAFRADGKKYVGKNSLTEEELIKAKIQAREKTGDSLTDDDKKEQRRAANRLSAFQSRQRRKIIIEDLQKTVAQISKDNANERKKVADLQAELESVKQENEMLRQMLTSSQGNSGIKDRDLSRVEQIALTQQDQNMSRRLNLLRDPAETSLLMHHNVGNSASQMYQGLVSYPSRVPQPQLIGEVGGPTSMFSILNELASIQNHQQARNQIIPTQAMSGGEPFGMNNVVSLLHSMQNQRDHRDQHRNERP
jgi:hypothetical protein